MPTLSIIVPVLNEEETIDLFLQRVSPFLDAAVDSWEVIFVDDGSTDSTAQKIDAARALDSRVKLVQFTRNFGKEAALTAGLEWSSGDAVIPMDVDLQDPPELIGEFVKLWREGYEIVFGQRSLRANDTGLKRITAGMFYKVFNMVAARPIDENAGDYRLMSRKAVEATLQLRERNRFMKGLFAWVGFKTAAVQYERPAREAGTSKFTFWKLWNFALDGITSFSTVPLRIWTYVGAATACGALVYMLWTIGAAIIDGNDVPGYASLMTVMLFLGAVQLISLGFIGEYLGRLYVEAKQRPIYLTSRIEGCAKPTQKDDPESL